MNLHGSIGSPAFAPKRAPRYDCGGEFLTVAEIAERTGTSESGIYQRLKKGQRGKELMRGPRTKLYEVNGERLSIHQLCERTGLTYSAMHARIARGFTGKDLLVKK